MKFGRLTARLATRRFWLWLIACLVLAAVVFVAGMRVYWRVQLKREIARIQAEGYPTTFEELNAFYPAVPDEDNMALILTNAFALMDVELTEEEENLFPFARLTSPRAWRADDGTIDAVERLLRRYQPAIKLAHEAARRRQARFPGNSNERDLSDWVYKYAHTKRLVSVLGIKSHQHLMIGETVEATECVRVALRISDVWESQPMTIAMLVRAACLRIALDHLQVLLVSEPITEDGLLGLRQDLQFVRGNTSATRALAGEYAFFLHSGYHERSSLATKLDVVPLSDWSDFGDVKTSAGYFAYRLAGLADPDLLYSLNRLEKAIEASKSDESAWEFVQHGAARFDAELTEHKWYLASKDTFQSFILANYLKRVLEQKRLLAAADTALAVELFRRETGVLPDSLAALVPDLLESVPTDYESGQPMRILGTTSGFGVGTTTPLFQVRTNFAEPSPTSAP